MESTHIVQEYFEAWNRRDPEAVVDTFADGGTYTAPNVPEGVTGIPSPSTRPASSRPSPTSRSTCSVATWAATGWWRTSGLCAGPTPVP
jgi:hypothetical protein